MKMTIKEFLTLWEDGTHDDVDVYDNVCEEIGIAYCNGYKLTKEGTAKFNEVLSYNIDVNEKYGTAIVDVDDADEKMWKHKLNKAAEFFYAIAGYCADSDFNKWFIECE